MNVARIITVGIILGTVAVWVVWDVIAVLVWGRSATESIFIFAWTLKYPQLVFILGYLMGHLTWGQKPEWTMDDKEAVEALQGAISDIQHLHIGPLDGATRFIAISKIKAVLESKFGKELKPNDAEKT